MFKYADKITDFVQRLKTVNEEMQKKINEHSFLKGLCNRRIKKQRKCDSILKVYKCEQLINYFC